MTDSTPGTDLVYASANLDQRKGYAQSIAAAGDLLPKSLWAPVHLDDGRTELRPSPGKVFLMTETGDMLHIHPIAALNGVNIIEGKPTVSPALMRALIQRAGHKVRVKEAGTIEGGDYAVTVTIVRSDDPDHPFEKTWTPHKAARAGLCTYALNPETKVWQVRARSSRGNPLPWESYPESLCLARATREVANMGASDVIFGVYTPEELGARVNEAGEMIDVTPTSVDRTPQVRFDDVQDAEIVEQDHDGPGVTAAMRDAKPETQGINRNRGVANETRGSAASNEQTTPAQSKRPGGSRGAGATPTGTAEPTRDKSDVWFDWAAQISEVDDLDRLIKLHAEAAEQNVLDHRSSTGVSIEDTFLARRLDILNAQAEAAAAPTPDAEEPTLAVYDDETPF